MQDQEKAKLLELRTKVLNDIIPLTENGVFDPSQKFLLLIAAARLTGDTNSFSAAYAAASSIEDPEDKANALFELLEEIDIELGDVQITAKPTPAQPEVAPVEKVADVAQAPKDQNQNI